MIGFILLLLIVLWLLGFIAVPLTAVSLFSLAGRAITLNDLLVFFVILWLIGLLPYPFQEIGGVLFLLWVLGALGIVSIAGFSNIMLLAIIVGVVVFLFRGRYYS